MGDFIKGMDLSSLLEVERMGGRYFDQGTPDDAITILKGYGMNLVRLRLWNDPYSEDGAPYGGGGNDLGTVLSLAKPPPPRAFGSRVRLYGPGT